ncbi:MAG: glycosyltransferase family 4 protein [Actinomycetota bacterium]
MLNKLTDRLRQRRAARSVGKRVVIVVQNLPVPFDRRVWLEATSLTEAGYNVTCICPKAKGFDKSFEVIEGIRIHRYKLPIDAGGPLGFVFEFAWCFLRTAMKLGREGLTRGVDVLHVCNPPESYFPLGWTARAFGAKFLFDHHDLSPEMFDAKFTDGGSKIMRRGLLLLERETFRAADLVITTNESHRAIAVDRGGMDRDDVIIVRSGPDLERLNQVEPVAKWRNGKKHLVAYLGEICEQDGVDHLVRAMVEVRDRHGRDDVHCVLMGGGPHWQAVKDYATEIGADDICEFTGRVSDEVLCEVLSSADIGVDPDPLTPWSDQSTMNKIMEYMYFELPIVSYDLKEARVSAGDAALFAAEHTEASLADSIVELLDDPEARSRMGKLGRERIETQLSWEHSEPHLLRAYDRLVGPGR